jgi:cytochrome c
MLVLRPTRVEAEEADLLFNMEKQRRGLGSIHNKSYFVLKNIDLKGISRLTYRYASKDHDATIEVHAGSLKGPVISTLDYKATGEWRTYNEVSAPIQDPGTKQDLYFVVVKKEGVKTNLLSLDWINFEK